MRHRRILTAALVAAGVPIVAPAQSVTPAVRTWRQQHEAEIVRELADLVSIPDVARDHPNILKAAEAVRAMLARRGISARILDNGDAPPAVFGELRTPGATRTIGLYAHFDGQPVNPPEWSTPPFQPTLRAAPGPDGSLGAIQSIPSSGRVDPESRLYGRGTGDDRAPIVAMLAAVDALRATGNKPTVNLKFFFDGEEEAGSAHVRAILDRESDAMRADVWLFCDSPMHQSRKMQIVFGARGDMGLTMTVYGPSRALHSGHYGNWAPNPASMLVDAVATMRSGDGTIRIDHFMDDVPPISATDRAAIHALPVIDDQLKHELLLGGTEAGNALLAERILLPAVNIRGMTSGQVGALATNSIPVDASASIDFRLVPNQTPEHVRELVEAHLRARGWLIVHGMPADSVRLAHDKVMRLDWGGGGAPAVKTSMDLPVSRALRSVVTEAIGYPVLAAPMMGGSLPIDMFANVLKVPLIIVPIANHDDNQHAKDENIRVQNIYDGIEVFAAIMTRLGPAWSGVVP
ncbi:MAG TPA: M20/M25/M40 family metallo-hydrolase [Gemmatimonadaceae bacterium]|nr:M20/M25/M40 family metallo-hydrolase [Gemmatimonadaceae bacterium]